MMTGIEIILVLIVPIMKASVLVCQSASGYSALSFKSCNSNNHLGRDSISKKVQGLNYKFF